MDDAIEYYTAALVRSDTLHKINVISSTFFYLHRGEMLPRTTCFWAVVGHSDSGMVVYGATVEGLKRSAFLHKPMALWDGGVVVRRAVETKVSLKVKLELWLSIKGPIGHICSPAPSAGSLLICRVPLNAISASRSLFIRRFPSLPSLVFPDKGPAFIHG